MLIKNVYIREDQEESLRSFAGTLSEHIRAAIDQYIQKKKQEQLSASLSPSMQKGVKHV